MSIVNHENRDAVLASLAALAEDDTRDAEIEVIVVDNASQDGSVDAIRNAFPDVEVVARGDRAGYGANHNVALRRASGRYVLLLNDDARVRPGTIDALRRTLDADAGVSVAAPAVQTPAGELEATLFPRPSLRMDALGAVRPGRAPTIEPASPRAIGWATGCALMVRRDSVMKLGGFDEGYFMYSEEIDLCTRLADAGYRVTYVPEAVVVHEGQASTGVDSPERAVEMSRSRLRYWRRHYRPAHRVAAQVIVAAQFLLLALAARVRRRPARPLLLQAAGCFGDFGSQGLRERAEAFNRARAA